MKEHISYSELRIWAECPFKHKIIYIDNKKGFQGNEYTAFGTTIHTLCENAVQGLLQESEYDDFFDESVIDIILLEFWVHAKFCPFYNLIFWWQISWKGHVLFVL